MRRACVAYLGVLSILTFAVACGGDDGGGGGGNIDGGLVDGDGSPINPPIDFIDGGGPIVAPEGCVEGSPECNDCIDNDEDGLFDGNDFECISPIDNDESSFATGIPGDNKDEKNQDCFFDGDSGAGNDGCNVHVCCLTPGPCDDPKYNEAQDCTVSDKCKNNCGALTPPGCDCFGCCTLCDADGCHDIIINPAVSPNCDETNLGDPDACTPCNKLEECGPVDCTRPDDCILCPGELPENLPAECEGTVECPNGAATCATNDDCASGGYCSQGCCNDGYIVP